jgi:hypothetical protein
MFYWLNRPPQWQLTIALVILAFGPAAGAFARDLPEFLRSLAHVTNSVLMVLICLDVRIGRGEEVGRSFNLFCLLASIVALVIMVQALSFNLLRDFRVAGLLGAFGRPGRAYFLEWPAGSSRQDSCQRRHDERTGDCPRQRPELALASWRKRFATLLFSQKAEW